jgi:serine/threonine protein kinase
MRTLVRGIVESYRSPTLEGQEEGFVVFRGEDDTGQPVSIRILARPLAEQPQVGERFRRLAQAIRGLNHPNIAPVQRVGDNAGLPYIVTRLIEKARPLAEELDQIWPVDLATDLVMQAGRALDHGYSKGIVHGDLTPDKITVQENGQVRVSGFGLSALLDLAGAGISQAASPYLAPERRAGTPADARADVYSLAAILYSLLTQRPPVVVQGAVQPPSRYNADVSPELDQVVVKGLAANPLDRYPDAKAFLAALGAVVLAPMVQKAVPGSQATTCPNCGAENQTGRFCRRCGKRLDGAKVTNARPPAQSKLDEPIQITQVEVSSFQPETTFETGSTTIAQPLAVASETVSELFPKPLEMPTLDNESLWPTVDSQAMISMPEPPPMPVIDWGEIAPAMPVVPTIEEAVGSPERKSEDA